MGNERASDQDGRIPSVEIQSARPVPHASWTGSRLELLGWMKRNAPNLADLYDGAVRLLYDKAFPGRTRFISHAVREIRNGLPFAITGGKAGRRLEYAQWLDRIVELWKQAGIPAVKYLPGGGLTGSETKINDSALPMPRRIVSVIGELLVEHESVRQKRTDTAIALFEAIAPENRKLRDSLRPIVRQWIETTEWFMQKTHDPRIKDEIFDEEELHRKFELFELTLLGVVQGFFKTTDGLDAILEEANS